MWRASQDEKMGQTTFSKSITWFFPIFSGVDKVTLIPGYMIRRSFNASESMGQTRLIRQ
jgi:hypothetical protein